MSIGPSMCLSHPALSALKHLQLFEVCCGSSPMRTVYKLALVCSCDLSRSPECDISVGTFD